MTRALRRVPPSALAIGGTIGLVSIDIIVRRGGGKTAAEAMIAVLLGLAVGRLVRSWTAALGGLLLVVLLIPSDGRVVLPGGLPFQLEPYRFVVGFLVVGWIASLLVDPRVKMRKSGFEGPLLMIGLAVLGSELSNPGRVSSVSTHVIKYVWLFAFFLLAFYMVVSVVRTRVQLDRLITVMVSAGCLVGLAAAYERQKGINLFNEYLPKLLPIFHYIIPPTIARDGHVRAQATAGHPIELSSSMSMLMPLAAYLAITRKQARWWIAMVALLLGDFASGSRTGIVGLLIVIVVFVCLRPRQTLRCWPALIPVIPVLHFAAPGALGGLQNMFFPSGGLVAQQSSTINGQANNRLSRWGPEMKEFAAHNPLVGEGFGTRVTGLKYGNNAIVLDDQWLGTLLETGLLGIGGWLWLFFRVIRRLGARAKLDPDSPEAWLAVALAAAVANFAVQMYFYDAFSFIQATFIVYTLIAFAAVLLELPGGARRRILAAPATGALPPAGGAVETPHAGA